MLNMSTFPPLLANRQAEQQIWLVKDLQEM